ncbi:MAG: acyl-CoA synthetase [Gammaproteobacteria bacterium]|tara:strand:- start:380 stop:1999 length:1620 start_codon:yes stop_codon:yes gene_type:complete
MNMHFASVFEKISKIIPEKPALVCEDKVLNWEEFEDQAAKLANYLENKGLSFDSKVGLYLHNSNEYLVAQFATFKNESVPINVNYRYQEDELIYLLDNSDAEAIFYQACYAERIKAIKDKLPKIKAYIQVMDGSEDLLEGSDEYSKIIQKEDRQEEKERSEENFYMLYTGGTTGMPKGVMYKQGSFLSSMMKTAFAMGFPVPENIEDIEKIIKDKASSNELPVSLVGCPLMHGTGMWLGAFLPHLSGGSVVTMPTLGFDPDRLWREVESKKASSVVIVGDAFARPMLDSLNKASEDGNSYSIDSLQTIISSGVMWSSEVKDGLLKHKDMVLIDTMGSTEGGMGSSISSRDNPAETAKFNINPGVVIIDDEGKEVTPGSGIRGKIGTSGLVPEGYYKDPDKSDETFKEFNGVRYSFPGDYALLEEDGSITLLGRGSNCINTAGEKVYPEEIEEALKLNESVYDCLVVGLTDEKFGQKVVAVVSSEEGNSPSEAELVAFLKTNLAGYKVPKSILITDEVKRAPNGKANYKWAREFAETTLS